jgi:hypothetical protein
MVALARAMIGQQYKVKTSLCHRLKTLNVIANRAKLASTKNLTAKS